MYDNYSQYQTYDNYHEDDEEVLAKVEAYDDEVKRVIKEIYGR